MFHIEFVGMPGAGKSTIRKRLIHALQDDGCQCLGAEEALYSVLKKSRDDGFVSFLLMLLPEKTACNHIYSLFNSCKSQIVFQSKFLAGYGGSLGAFLNSDEYQAMSSEQRSLAISRFLKTISSYQIIKENVNDASVVVFDSGFVQKAMGFFLIPEKGGKEISWSDVGLYLDNIPLPNVVVFVGTEIGTCYDRLMDRNRGVPQRLAGLDSEQIRCFLHRCNAFFSQVIKWVEDKGGVVIHIANDGSIDAVCEVLNEKISATIKRG